MAETKTIQLNVDTKQAVNAMENLTKANKGVHASFEDVYGELQPLTSRMGEAEDRLYELGLAGQTTTKEYKELLKTVGNYRQVQIKTDLAVDAAAGTLGQKLGGAITGVTAGFSLAQGVMGAFGTESKQVEEALLKVQAAMAIQQGVQGVRDAIPVFRQMKDAAMDALKGIKTGLLATGIGVLIVGLGLVVAYWDDILEATGFGTEASKKYAEQQKKVAKEAQEASKKQSKFIVEESAAFVGLIYQLKGTNAKSKERANLIKEVNGKYGTTLKNLSDEFEFTEQLNVSISEYIRLQSVKFKIGKNEELISGALEKQYDLEKKVAKERIEILKVMESTGKSFGETARNLDYAKSIVELDKVNDRLLGYGVNISKLKGEQDKLTEGGKKYVEGNKDVVTSVKEVSKNTDELAAIEKERLDNIKDLQNELLDSIAQVEQDSANTKLTARQLELQNANDFYFNLITQAEQNEIDTATLEQAKVDKLALINKTFNESDAVARKTNQDKIDADQKIIDDKKIEAEKAVAEQKRFIQEQGFNSALQGIGIIKGLFEKSKGVQKSALIAESAIGIAKMVISTKLANIAALATPQAIATSGVSAIPVIASNNISAGIGIAANIAATAKGLSALGGGGAPTGGGGLGGESRGPGATQITPNFNVVGNTGINQLNNLNQPIQAFVVSGEMTSQQQLDRNKQSLVTL